MSTTNYVFLVLGGGPEYFKQLYFALVTTSFFASPNSRFIVYTDSKNELKGLSRLCELREVSEDNKKEWIGQYNYFYRIKLLVLQDSINRDQGHTVFLDTDIMAINDLSSFEQGIESQMAFMHTKENKLSEDKSPDKVQMWNTIKGKEFYGIHMDQDISLWNSGIIAIPNSNAKQVVDEAIGITDELCEQGVECRIKEQFALGIVIQKYYPLNPSTKYFIHYWGNKKEWTKEIEAWSCSRHISGVPTETPISKEQLDHFQSLPIQRTPRSFGKTLSKIKDKFYEDKIKTHREAFPDEG